MVTDAENLSFKDIEALAAYPTGKMRGVEFAGILVREDADAIYVADPQGTWMLPRASVQKFGPWEHSRRVPEELRAAGRPVRVTLKEDATFYEIRPWRVCPGPIETAPPVPLTNEDVSKIFSVGSGGMPITAGRFAGEMLLRNLERRHSRRLGYGPDHISRLPSVKFDDDGGDGGTETAAGATSSTGDQDSNGGSTGADTDPGFD
jgi:hypothetical protein